MATRFYSLFAIIAYAVFFATFLYLIAFVGNFPMVSRTVDIGPDGGAALAGIVDAALIALFGVQHSIMARKGFKAAWTRIVPEPIERSVYVLASSIVLMILFAFWRPIGGDVWRVETPIAVAALWTVFATGWALVLISTFLISHFELFGLKQAFYAMRGKAAEPPRFRRPWFYNLVRHPLYVGFLLAFWATPVMSLGHLLLAAGMTVYILIAIQYEERDLVDVFGADYRTYQRQVGMLAPHFRRRAD